MKEIGIKEFEIFTYYFICQAVVNSSNTYSKIKEDRNVGNYFYFLPGLMEQMLLGSQQLPSTSVVARPE